ncbi:MAG TPA: glycosyltransferase family 39 protein [Vicinamibacterales bacterium]|nr:glycosyltransferase family 39 protein [Vicinamibacterales bacterium]
MGLWGVGAVLLHRLARPLMGGRLALVPAFIYAADMNLIQNQSTLTAEPFLLPQILLALWALDRYRITDDARWLLAASTAIALVFITRNVVAVPLVMATVLAWVFWRRPLRVIVRDAAVIGIALFVVSIPVALASAEREGRPRFVTQLATVVWSFDMGPDSAMISNRRLVEMGIVPFEDPLGSAARAFGQLDRVVAFYAEAVPVRFSGLLFAASPGLSDPLLIVNPAQYPNSFDGVTRVLRAVGLAVVGTFLIIGRPWRAHPQLVLYASFATLYVAVFHLRIQSEPPLSV